MKLKNEMSDLQSIIFDLDGTLLNSQKEISEKSLMAVQKLIKRGLRIVLCSGRHFSEIKSYVDLLNLDKDSHIIACDGQYIYNAIGELIWNGEFLDVKDIKNICQILNCRSLCFYTDKYDYHLDVSLIRFIWHKIRERRGKEKYVFRTLKSREICNIEKVALIGANGCEAKHRLSSYNVHVLKSGRVEIINKNVSKYNAICKLIEIVGLQITSLMYFGDEENDIECFENIPCCIAMENAVESIKENAKFVTKSNDTDGIFYALQYYKLIN